MVRSRLALVCAGLLLAAAGCTDPAEPADPDSTVAPADDDPAPTGDAVVVEATETTFASEGVSFDGYRVTYRIEGVDGGDAVVSGVIGVPPGEAPAGGWPVVAIAHGTTGVADDCAPSRSEAIGGLIGSIASTIAAGNVVAVTDYEGLGTPGIHPYLQSASEARSVAGSVQAAAELLPGQLADRWVAFGLSQGGHAALALATLGADVVPGLELAGVVAIAPPMDLRGLMFGGQSDIAGAVAASFADGYLGEGGDDDGLLTEAGSEAVALANEICAGPLYAAVPSAEALFQPGQADPGSDFGDAIDANAIGATALAVPAFVAQGDADTTVPPASVLDGVAQLCALGSSVELRVYPGADHISVLGVSGADAAQWVLDRLAGRPPTPSC